MQFIVGIHERLASCGGWNSFDFIYKLLSSLVKICHFILELNVNNLQGCCLELNQTRWLLPTTQSVSLFRLDSAEVWTFIFKKLVSTSEVTHGWITATGLKNEDSKYYDLTALFNSPTSDSNPTSAHTRGTPAPAPEQLVLWARRCLTIPPS